MAGKYVIKIPRPAALLEGGPRHGWAYFVDEIERMVAAENAQGRVFPYKPTKAYKVHPFTEGKVHSQVWRYVA